MTTRREQLREAAFAFANATVQHDIERSAVERLDEAIKTTAAKFGDDDSTTAWVRRAHREAEERADEAKATMDAAWGRLRHERTCDEMAANRSYR